MAAKDRFLHVMFEGKRTAPVARRPFTATPQRQPRSEATPLSGDEAGLVSWAFQHSGLDADRYRPQPMQRRIAACLRALRTADAAEAKQLLEHRPELLAPALDSLLIGTSEFFRDTAVFACLREQILPEMLAGGATLQVWSVACSDGAEAYSIAMLAAETRALERVRITATDCRSSAIEQARRGIFSEAAMKSVPAELRQRYFQPTAKGYQAAGLLREAITWTTMDVFACRDDSRWDLVLCRNVAIYLQPAASSDLWHRIVQAIRPGGVLMTGKAERPPATLGLQRIGQCLYSRRT